MRSVIKPCIAALFMALPSQAQAQTAQKVVDIPTRPGVTQRMVVIIPPAPKALKADVGRYLEFRIPTSEEIILDFNKCYNPYCSYSPNYSCPIPPEVNDLPMEVKSGEKKFNAGAH